MHIRVAASPQGKLVDFARTLVRNCYKIRKTHIRSVPAAAALVALNPGLGAFPGETVLHNAP